METQEKELQYKRLLSNNKKAPQKQKALLN
jgi:hypothetical protein